jgi:hypothetical protein
MVCGNLPFLTQDQILAKQLTWRSRDLSPQLKVSAVIFPQLKVSDLSSQLKGSDLFPQLKVSDLSSQLKVSDLTPAQGQ